MTALAGNVYRPPALMHPSPFAYVGNLICLEMVSMEITFYHQRDFVWHLLCSSPNQVLPQVLLQLLVENFHLYLNTFSLVLYWLLSILQSRGSVPWASGSSEAARSLPSEFALLWAFLSS